MRLWLTRSLTFALTPDALLWGRVNVVTWPADQEIGSAYVAIEAGEGRLRQWLDERVLIRYADRPRWWKDALWWAWAAPAAIAVWLAVYAYVLISIPRQMFAKRSVADR